MLTLKNAQINKFYKISGIKEDCSDKIKRRIFDLGFIHNQSVRVLRKSLLGETFLIEIRGYCLSVRSNVAQNVLLEGAL